MGNSFRQTVAGIFAHEAMNESTLLSGHVKATMARAEASEGEYLIAPQDTTYYNYSGQGAMSGLGVIQGKVRGLMQHNVILLNEAGIPLGILSQQYWTRQGAKDLPAGELESGKWQKGLNAINEQASQCSKNFIAVEDREGDVFSLFKEKRLPNVSLLVRVHQPRNLEIVSSGVICKLSEASPYLSDYGELKVKIYRDKREVFLTLRLRAGVVNVHPRQDLSIAKHQVQGLSLVIAEEIACLDIKTGEDKFFPEKAVKWCLLTSLSVTTTAEVERVVHFYALRWRIERFHYTLKSGALNVEKLQFDDIQTLSNALTFYSVVAWQLLALTYALRDNPDQKAQSVFEQSELELVERLSGKKIKSLREAVLGIAKIIGFAPSKRQPLPGVKVLAMALERFFFMKVGFTAFSKPLQD